MAETEPPTDTTAADGASLDLGGALYGLKPAVVRAIVDAAQTGDARLVRRLIHPLHYSDVADLIERLDPETRDRVLEYTGRTLDPKVLAELDDQVREQIVEQLDTKQIVAAATELETDDAVELIEDLDKETAEEVLEALPEEEREAIEEALSYPEESAGRRMQSETVVVPVTWTVGETIDHMRESVDLPTDFYDVFVVDQLGKPIGTIPLNRLLRTRRPVKIGQIMKGDLTVIPATMDQEEAALLFKQRDLTSAPVVDENGKLVGMITVDDMVDVIEKETEEDMLRLAGVAESDIHFPAMTTAQLRIRWLIVTLCNTIVASIVISQFQATIEKIVALAVLMPIVAAMGGNAGMQVVTVTVRALATKHLTPGNMFRVVRKEVLVGLMNGVALAAVMGTITAFWFHNTSLSLVLAGAMLFNMIWAGIAGTLIPLALFRMRIDPAIAAGPFLTTTTDVLGFFVFLGVATLFLI
ncbi:MAG: magnesium transporter [Alphaproteobacteria bacterium]